MKYIVFLVFIAVFVSCQETTEGDATVVTNQSKTNLKKSYAQVLAVNGNSLKKIDNWQEYRSLNEFLKQYQSITPKEALNNSKELHDLVESLKDSVQPKFLVSPAFDARVNLLHNETMRLYDMSTISSIKDKEVNLQVAKLLEAFSSMNSKINTIVKQEELDKQIDDPKFNRLFPDSTEIRKVEIPTEDKVKKIPLREKKMKESKVERMKLRKEKLKYIQKQQNDKKKKKNN